MTLLLLLHLAAALLAPPLVRRLGAAAFAVLALVPAASTVWLGRRLTEVTAGQETVEAWTWLPSLDFTLTLRLDPLSVVTGMLVTGVGTLVLIYCSRYFREDRAGLTAFAANLVAFAGAMLGLVLSDDVLLLYVFWELTTVFSYLLIGHTAALKASRQAAMQALIVTTFGGLAMLVGLIVLAEQAGSYLLSDIVAAPPTGPATVVALVLILMGALSKSAIVPFHFWLPAAMAAPTPVSAYLHAAAMVKAGVYLLARLSPGFADVGPWRALVVTLGLATMLLGAWRALRQHDLKLLLAYGTVSQLGFLVVLTGAGSRDALLAGLTLLVAHGMFKATLFLTVGVIDHTTGTRDLRELSGLRRTAPVLAVTAGLAAASMAGLPPFLGFVAKETAFEAFSVGALGDGGELWSRIALVALVLGSALTVAYSARFWWGAFGDRREGNERAADTRPHPAGAALLAPPAVLAGLGLLAGLAVPLIDPLLAAHADSAPVVAPQSAGVTETYHLALWHGVNPALLLSVVSIGIGIVLFVARDAVERGQARLHHTGDAQRSYRRLMRLVDHLAIEVTAATQRGSLPTYLGVILVVLTLLPGWALITAGQWAPEIEIWDTPLQAVVGVLIVTAGLLATRARQRLSAVLLVGVTGYGTGLIFLLHGAPDLALTQFLVETITLVAFVLVLRKLPKDITERHRPVHRRIRAGVALAVGALVAVAATVAISARQAPAVSLAFPSRAYEFGGGSNVVNVALVDIRAWDTLGEIAVLVVAATGVASLVFLRKRTGGAPRSPQAAGLQSGRGDGADGSGSWLRAGQLLDPERRSVVLEVVTRLIFHTVVVLSIYLLFAGHNVPGGGFAGGLVAGLALVVRYLAGGRYELGEAAPVDAGLVLGLGLLFAGSTGAAGLLFGADVLQTAIVEQTVPVLGDVKLVTSLFFDIGVYLVVVGLVLDVLRSLGAELDQHEELEPEEEGAA